MPYKSLQQLREEHQVHHNRAMQLFEEAAIIRKLMKAINPLSEEYLKIQKQLLEKNTQAAAEIKKTLELSRQYVQELERLKNRDLN